MDGVERMPTDAQRVRFKGVTIISATLPVIWSKKEDNVAWEKNERSKIGMGEYLNSPSDHRRRRTHTRQWVSGGERHRIYGKNRQTPDRWPTST